MATDYRTRKDRSVSVRDCRVRRVFCAFIALCMFLVTVFSAVHANAQGKPKRSQGHYIRAGRAAERQGKWDVALSEYETANSLGPNAATVAGMARAHYELGHVLEAYDAYTVLQRMLVEPALTRAKVQERLAALSARVGTLVLAVNIPDADVAIDGKSVAKSPTSGTYRLEAGKHQVNVRKSDGKLVERKVEVGGGGTPAMLVVDDPPPPAPAPEPAPAPPKVERPPPPPPPTPSNAWEVPHGSKSYVAMRAANQPVIDGVLDEAVWQKAPQDDRFLSERSKPYGQPTLQPTIVQVAYDEENLYVAFRCAYAKDADRDDTYTQDETDLSKLSEAVTVFVDPLHGHTNAFGFTVSRAGTYADIELSQSGLDLNLSWRGVWTAATRRSRDSWTAEFRIPWGTIRMPSERRPVSIGVNFTRREPGSGEFSIWSAQPPATPVLDTNFFGHLEGLVDIQPTQRLYLQPYVAVAFDQTPPPTQSPLTDITGTNRQLRGFAGLYARYQPPGPVRFDGTFNPNFVGVDPDAALANLDRFELEFPETRPFFAEDLGRFKFGGMRYSFGDLGTQLFYSRRIGLVTNRAGLTEVVPVLYGVKSVLRSGGTEAAAMNVALSPNTPTLSMNDNISVGRFSQTFDEGSRMGGILLGRTGDNGRYIAGGVDGTVAMFNRHLALNAFVAQTKSDATRESGAVQTSLDWSSEDFYASAAYIDIGKAFDAELGYFPITGVRSDLITAGYTPVLRNDLLQQVALEGQLLVAQDRGFNRVFDRGVVSATATTFDKAQVQVQVLPAIEEVSDAFPLANGRVQVAPGRYDQMVYSMKATTAPRKPVVGGIGYLGGDLFGGRRRVPFASLGLNLGHFTSNVLYRLYLVEYDDTTLYGHQVSASAGYSYTPLAKSTLVIQANTFDGRSLAQFLTSYTFGYLSTIALVVRATSGSTVQVQAHDWYDNPNLSAILSFTYGVAAF